MRLLNLQLLAWVVLLFDACLAEANAVTLFESLLQVKQCSDSTFKGSFLTNKSKRRCRVTLIGGICLSIILCVS